MILIADSGSTKTMWCLADANGEVRRMVTRGINPVLMDDESVLDILRGELLPALGPDAAAVTDIFYYGAGVLPQQVGRVQSLLSAVMPGARAFANNDLLGAARGLFGIGQGIACILGTGSNSGLYDGNIIVDNVPALGYVLGDEGSGAVMGRLFVGNLYKRQLPASLLADFELSTGLDMATVIDRVYRKPMPNRFLASLAPYIASRLDVTSLRQMVVGHFRRFFTRNVLAYGRPDLPVGIVGGIGYHFSDCVAEAARTVGISRLTIINDPAHGLVAYHLKKAPSQDGA